MRPVRPGVTLTDFEDGFTAAEIAGHRRFDVDETVAFLREETGDPSLGPYDQSPEFLSSEARRQHLEALEDERFVDEITQFEIKRAWWDPRWKLVKQRLIEVAGS